MNYQAEVSGAGNVRDVPEFCVRNKLSKALFYKLMKVGKGPRIMKVGARTMISPEAEAEWRRACESEAASTSRGEAA